MFRRCYICDIDTIIKKGKVFNMDLILAISDEIFAYEPNKVFMTKVKAHCGVRGNEAADTLAKIGTTKN